MEAVVVLGNRPVMCMYRWQDKHLLGDLAVKLCPLKTLSALSPGFL